MILKHARRRLVVGGPHAPAGQAALPCLGSPRLRRRDGDGRCRRAAAAHAEGRVLGLAPRRRLLAARVATQHPDEGRVHRGHLVGALVPGAGVVGAALRATTRAADPRADEPTCGT